MSQNFYSLYIFFIDCSFDTKGNDSSVLDMSVTLVYFCNCYDFVESLSVNNTHTYKYKIGNNK